MEPIMFSGLTEHDDDCLCDYCFAVLQGDIRAGMEMQLVEEELDAEFVKELLSHQFDAELHGG